MNPIKFLKLHENSKLPTRAYDNAAGFDVYPLEDGYLLPGVHTIVPLGFATEFDTGYGAFIFDRGGMGVKGVVRFAGVIDSDYRGEWRVILFNSTNSAIAYEHHKAIAQVVFLQVHTPDMIEVPSLSDTARGEKRYGSSDKGGRIYEASVGFNAMGGMGGG